MALSRRRTSGTSTTRGERVTQRALVAVTAIALLGLTACAEGATTVGGSLDGGLPGQDSSLLEASSDGHNSLVDGKAKNDGASHDTGTGLVGIGGSCAQTACAPPGTCTSVGGGQFCTEPCPAACPTGTFCAIVEGSPLCVTAQLGQECKSCATDADCTLPSDACLTGPRGDSFCARDCTTNDDCPNDYSCEDRSTYESTASDAGPFDAGAAEDAGGASKWCVPKGGGECSCTPANDGAVRDCSITNSFGTCTGQSTCAGSMGMWSACPVPAAEICNGIDDNCNGMIDEGAPADLCANQGDPVHSSWLCSDGLCLLNTCDPGWTAFPPGNAGAGCACQIEPNTDCALATNAGSVQDVGGTPLVITGDLSNPTDVNVWTFTANDIAETNTNSYHVAIKFTAPTPNNEFVFDVIRGSACSDTPTGATTDVTSYDWCVNASNGSTQGELSCGPTAAVHCNDDTSPYYLRVYRAAGVTPTCTQYQITITGGGGTCDLTQSCQ
jgi:hypothetical protein